MTEQLRQVLDEVERLSSDAQDSIAALIRDALEERERKRRAAFEALDRLAELTADLPPVDAVEVARQSREDLERRALF